MGSGVEGMARDPWTNLRRTRLKRRHDGPVDAGCTQPGLSSPEDINWNDACTIKSFLVNTPTRNCEGCGRSLLPGHTAFMVKDENRYSHLLCYECGVAVRDVLGLTDITTRVDVPAYGGGPTAPRQQRRRRRS
jgi:hypothetical protein